MHTKLLKLTALLILVILFNLVRVSSIFALPTYTPVPIPSTYFATPTLTGPITITGGGTVIPVSGAPVIVAPGDSVPMETCGIAGDPAKQQCCFTPKRGIIGFSILKKIPYVGDWLGIVDTALGAFSGVQAPCIYGHPDRKNYKDPMCKCVLDLTPSPVKKIKEMCKKYVPTLRPGVPSQVRAKAQKMSDACIDCAVNKSGYWSGIGCIPLTVGGVVGFFMVKVGMSLGGILALLCIIYGAISLQLSQGNPEKVKKARELITSCVLGLILIISSVFILKVIGVDILRIPGFT